LFSEQPSPGFFLARLEKPPGASLPFSNGTVFTEASRELQFARWVKAVGRSLRSQVGAGFKPAARFGLDRRAAAAYGPFNLF